MADENKGSNILLIVLALAFAGVLTFAYNRAREATGMTVAEKVPGDKFSAGTWKTVSGSSRHDGAKLAKADVTIDVDVQMFSFTPKVIKVKKGQIVKLKLHGKDDGQLPYITGTGSSGFTGHGFQILGPYGVWVTGLRKDVNKEIVFKATVAGTFNIECTVLCGLGHGDMRGTFVVE